MTAQQQARMADVAAHRTEREQLNDKILAGDAVTPEQKSEQRKSKLRETRLANKATSKSRTGITRDDLV